MGVTLATQQRAMPLLEPIQADQAEPRGYPQLPSRLPVATPRRVEATAAFNLWEAREVRVGVLWQAARPAPPAPRAWAARPTAGAPRAPAAAVVVVALRILVVPPPKGVRRARAAREPPAARQARVGPRPPAGPRLPAAPAPPEAPPQKVAPLEWEELQLPAGG